MIKKILIVLFFSFNANAALEVTISQGPSFLGISFHMLNSTWVLLGFFWCRSWLPIIRLFLGLAKLLDMVIPEVC